jgi:hypothetical protein
MCPVVTALRPRAFLLTVTGAGLLLAGCRPAERRCGVDADCPTGDICIGGYCGVGNRRQLAGDGPTPGDPAGVVIYGPRIQTFTASGPISLVSDQTVSGLQISNPSGPCITGANVTNVHIVDNLIGPCAADDSGAALYLTNVSSFTVEHNALDDIASGMYIEGSDASTAIVFHHNRVTRLRNPVDDHGSMIVWYGVNGSGHAVRCNSSDQGTPGYLDGPAYHILLSGTSGTAGSPIDVSFNKLRGGGPRFFSGGILVGVGGGAYTSVHDNILIEPGRLALGVQGELNSVVRNVVYAPTGYAWTSTNGVGLCVMRDGSYPCRDIEARDNRVLFFNTEGQNDEYDAGDCGTVAGWSSNTFGDTTLDAAVWDTPLPECLE